MSVAAASDGWHPITLLIGMVTRPLPAAARPGLSTRHLSHESWTPWSQEGTLSPALGAPFKKTRRSHKFVGQSNASFAVIA